MELVRLGDVATFINGYPFKPTDWGESGLEIIRIQNLTKSSKEVNYFSGKINDKYKIRKNDILISWSATLDIYEWMGKDAWLNQHIFKVKFDKLNVDKAYFVFAIKSVLNKVKEQVHGATMKHITKGKFDNIQIPLPPLETQKHIAQILDDAAALRDKTAQLIAAYDALAQSIFLDMFGDPVKNEKGWEVSNVGKVCSKILGGGTPRKSREEYFSGEIPWVTPKDMKKLYVNDSKIRITEKAVNESSAKLIPINSVLMVIRSGILKKKLPVAINTCIVTVNQDMKAFVANSNIIDVKYLMYFFQMAQKFLLAKVRAVTADNIEFDQIKQMIIPIPPIALQNQFAEKIALIEQQKELAKQELAASEDLFNCLLQKAFKGELA